MAGRGERFINNLDFQFLTNTIELDLSHIYGRGVYPTKNDINTFITDDLKVTAGMIIGTQSHPRFPKVFLQFEKEEFVAAVETRLEGGKMMSGKNIKIGVIVQWLLSCSMAKTCQLRRRRLFVSCLSMGQWSTVKGGRTMTSQLTTSLSLMELGL